MQFDIYLFSSSLLPAVRFFLKKGCDRFITPPKGILIEFLSRRGLATFESDQMNNWAKRPVPRSSSLSPQKTLDSLDFLKVLSDTKRRRRGQSSLCRWPTNATAGMFLSLLLSRLSSEAQKTVAYGRESFVSASLWLARALSLVAYVVFFPPPSLRQPPPFFHFRSWGPVLSTHFLSFFKLNFF